MDRGEWLKEKEERELRERVMGERVIDTAHATARLINVVLEEMNAELEFERESDTIVVRTRHSTYPLREV